MEKFAVIIPDRGDRPELLKHCEYQMRSQTMLPDHIYYCSDPPVDDQVDLVPRIRKGINMAISDGYDVVYIIENDDYYPDNYFAKNWISDYDFTGIPFTVYYNIFQAKFRHIEHNTHSSLFCTGLRTSMLSGFVWPSDKEISLDKHLWQYARESTYIKSQYKSPYHFPMGIKHGLGKCAGTGHFPADGFYDYIDLEYTWLKSHIRPYSFDFYMNLITSHGAPGSN